MKLSVKPFTMVGATTRSGLLSSPLRDRFESTAAPSFPFGKSDSIAVPGVEAVCVRWRVLALPKTRRKSSRIELASSGHESTEGR